ncbi:hypothetical protein ID866_5049 [Astraeus odoratus]|nr:hypothetical protein ID866_5049 [Astraeus odoratus]
MRYPSTSEDTKSRSRRVLVLSNPDPGESSSSEDDHQRVGRQPQPSYSALQQPSSSQVPQSPYRSEKPGHPAPLTTDLNHITSSHSNPTLSSPSSQSSNAVESTPPPSTPGQAIPPDIGAPLFTHDDGSAVHERTEIAPTSRLQKLSDKFWKSRRPSCHRPLEPDSSVHSSSTSSHMPTSRSQERVIMVTHDCHAYTTVDVTAAKSAAFIWERIFTEVTSAYLLIYVTPTDIHSKLKIPDEEQSSGFAIYRTQVNKAALGEALSDDDLLRLVRDGGDAEGSLKFLVCHPQARVQESSLPTSPVRPIPPPPSVFAPLVPRSKHSKSSRQESISSEDHAPDTGYEPSAVSDDFDDSEHRSTIRPHQYAGNLSGSFPLSSQGSRYENRQPPSPASAKLPYSGDRRRLYEADYNQTTVLPLSHRTPASEDMLTPRQHARRGSNAQDIEQTVRDSGRTTDYIDVEWPRNQPSPLGGLSRRAIPNQRVRGSPSTTDDPTAERRDIRAMSPRESDLANGHRSSSTGATRTPSTKRKHTRLDGPSLSIRPLQPHKTGGKPTPAGHVIAWKASDSPTSASSSKSLKNVKSMDMLKPMPPASASHLRTSPSRPQLSVSPNAASAATIRPLEPSPRPLRPLPPTQGSVGENISSECSQSTRSFPQPSATISTNSTAYLSPSQEPYPRPQSTSPSQQRYPKLVDTSTPEPSRKQDVQRTLVGMHHQSHSTGSVSKFGETPLREDGYGSPTLPVSLRPGVYGSTSVRPYGPPDTPPRSPVSAASCNNTSATSSALSYPSTGTVVPFRQSSTSIGQDTLAESTLRPDERDKLIWDLKSHISTQKCQQVDSSPQEDSVGSNDSYGTATEDLWSRRPLSQMIHEVNRSDLDSSCKSNPRPALNVITQSHNSNGRGVSSNFPPPPDYVPQLLPQPRPARMPRAGPKGTTFEESTWAHRPPPEDVYERLEDFFPEHDLDKPVIDANSGGTSPTTTEHPYGIPPDDRERITGVRGKKSIRIVAEEHKKRIDRTSRAESAYNSAMIRKRSTKLWGSRLEEVTTSQKKPTYTKSLPESPSGGPRRMSHALTYSTQYSYFSAIFKWVRGELIGRGTYGRVYLALNATTGEMIAVKQVEIPATASDKSDSRQANFVQALKMESETLKDLDHPHIVAYLGFEETPNFLSM